MLGNKCNMMLENIETIFLVTRYDVSQPSHLNSKANEHTYGHWSNILSEFNMNQPIHIHHKKKNQNDDIFESCFVTSRSKTTLKGYQQTFTEFIDSLKKEA